jgi:hypothetical protein
MNTLAFEPTSPEHDITDLIAHVETRLDAEVVDPARQTPQVEPVPTPEERTRLPRLPQERAHTSALPHLPPAAGRA